MLVGLGLCGGLLGGGFVVATLLFDDFWANFATLAEQAAVDNLEDVSSCLGSATVGVLSYSE